MNDDACEAYNTNSQIKLRTAMLKSSLCDCSDAAAIATDRNNKQYVSFTDYISKISNTQVKNAKDLVTVMLMYVLIEYSDNYEETLGLWQYHKAAHNDNMIDLESFKFKSRFINTNNADIAKANIFGGLLKCH